MMRSLQQALLPLRALVELIRVHRHVRAQRFQTFFGADTASRRVAAGAPRVDPVAVTEAVDRACAWYHRPSNCFHRSAVLVSLLRRARVDAEMVCGIRFEPYSGHAWVEVQGRVVNDDPAVQTEYTPVYRL